MSERNSMNEMFGQLKDYQVEAPLEVMELAIERANRKRKLRILVRWSAAFLLFVGAVMVWNWNGQVDNVVVPQNASGSSKEVAPSVDQIQEVSIEKNEEKNVSVPKSSKSEIESATTTTTNAPSECYGVENPNLPIENSAAPNQIRISDRDSVASAPEAKPIEKLEQEVKKSLPKGQRKLKLIIPQP